MPIFSGLVGEGFGGIEPISLFGSRDEPAENVALQHGRGPGPVSANAELGLADVAAALPHAFELFAGEVDAAVVRAVDGPNGDFLQQRLLAERLFLHRLPTHHRRRRGEQVRAPFEHPPRAVAARAEAADA